MKKSIKYFLYVLPAVLFFSYYPLMHFGVGESMNFELSLPLIWLVLFDIYAFFLIIKFKKIGEIFKNIVWLLFPVFMAFSLLWTCDLLRGILIGGVLWLVYFAGFSFYILKDYYNKDEFWQNFFNVFLISSLLVCLWCLLQCIFDVLGMERGYSLACAGCTYKVFGFPHPNGFAAEPQFMGNLLLAPIVVTIYLIEKKKFFSRKFLIFCLFIFMATLFLTLSRGAIYAFGAGLIFFVAIKLIHEKRWQSISLLVMALLAFLFTLNIQGILSEISPTNDTYISGISKVINQTTLGKIDLGGSGVKKEGKNEFVEEDIIEGSEMLRGDGLTIEREDEKEAAMFDGYIEISTDARTSAWRGALRTWAKDPATMIFGVGLGGALKAMYENGDISSSKEIINNQYISILLEGGIIGALLLVISLILLFRVIYKTKMRVYLFTLGIMYMISVVFFSGLPNALHIYLLFPILLVYSSLRKKLVS